MPQKIKLKMTQSGFSIVEIIVLIVVIALIMGFVYGGMKLHHASEIKSIIVDISKYQKIVKSFQGKYQQLPGDFDNAYEIWNDKCSERKENCNGNNNGFIDAGGKNNSEIFRSWQHLYLAGFIRKSFTGIGGGLGGQADIDINIPSTDRINGGFNLISISETDPNVPNNKVAGTYFITGSFVANNWAIDKLYTPSEAFAIDSKMDDGKADTGIIEGRHNYDGSWHKENCLKGEVGNRTYNTERKKIECVLYFPIEPFNNIK